MAAVATTLRPHAAAGGECVAALEAVNRDISEQEDILEEWPASRAHTVVALRRELRSRGLVTTGRKADLARRLHAALLGDAAHPMLQPALRASLPLQLQIGLRHPLLK